MKTRGDLPLWGGRRCVWGDDESAAHILGGEGDPRDWKFLQVGRWRCVWGPTVCFLYVLAPAVLTLTAASFMGFPAVGLVAVVDLGSGFLGLYVFLVAVTVACLGDWKTD